MTPRRPVSLAADNASRVASDDDLALQMDSAPRHRTGPLAGSNLSDLPGIVPIPARVVQTQATIDNPSLPTLPKFVAELEKCLRQVEAGGVHAATVREFRSRRHHDKAAKDIFDGMPGVDEKHELAAFVWMKANPEGAVVPDDFAIALKYLSRFKDKIFFSAPAIPWLEVLAAGDEAALDEFCAIINSCPDLDIYSVYQAVGRKRKIYVTYEATPIEQLLEEFNVQCVMGSFEAFFLEGTGPAKNNKGGVGFIRPERHRQLRAEGWIDVTMFRRLQARLHFESRPEILEVFARPSSYASIFAGFVSAYVDGYEMETHDLMIRLGAVLVRGR
jgi:hypothetical protein